MKFSNQFLLCRNVGWDRAVDRVTHDELDNPGGINLGGGVEIFRTHPKGLGDTGSFTWVKWLEYDNHPHPSNAKVYERIQL